MVRRMHFTENEVGILSDDQLIHLIDKWSEKIGYHIVSFDARTVNKYTADFQRGVENIYRSRPHLVPGLESRLSLDNPIRALFVALHMANLDERRRDLAVWTLQQLKSDGRSYAGMIAKLMLLDLYDRFPADPSVT
jgi:hypothetical protein